MEKINTCPHCYPAIKTHFFTKTASVLDYFVINPLTTVAGRVFPSHFLRKKWQRMKTNVLEKNISKNLIQLVDKVDRSQLSNGTLVFWDEAQRRGLSLFNLKYKNKHTEHFCLIIKDKKYFYSANPIFLLPDHLNYAHAADYDDKEVLRKWLIKRQFPCPQGAAFVSLHRALRHGKKLGYPLVVKPSFSSLSHHVSLNIHSEPALRGAFKIAKQINYKVIVEQYIPGDVHRALILDESLIACTVRRQGSVVGNGKDTIEKLIQTKNKHPFRGELGQKNTTLFKVMLTEQLRGLLKEQGVSLATRLEKGRSIFLSKKMNATSGADIANMTEQLHPETKILLENVHKTLNLPLSGLDFICQDLSLAWHRQPFAIIESNSLPGVSQHHYPSEGESINVAEKIWDFVLKYF